MGANATGGAADIADSQAAGNGPEYWDPVTDTAWTSYQVGGQWHESYYEGENGLYDVSQMVTQDGARGVGIWALGMESDGAQMIAALDGISPGAPPGTGPQSTSSSTAAVAAPAPTSAPGGSASAPSPSRTGGTAAPPAAASSPPTSGSGAGSGSGSGSQTASPSAPPAPTTTTTTASVTGVYNGTTVDLTPVASSTVLGVLPAGTVTDFQSNVEAYSCLNGAALDVYDNVNGSPVAEAVVPTDCIAQDFQLP
jgi:hypothetical protein